MCIIYAGLQGWMDAAGNNVYGPYLNQPRKIIAYVANFKLPVILSYPLERLKLSDSFSFVALCNLYILNYLEKDIAI